MSNPRFPRYGKHLGLVQVLDWEPPGLNGPGGLIRCHWATRKRYKTTLISRLGGMRLPEITQPVHVVYTRFGQKAMDKDNLAASSKIPFDALKEVGVIPDDNPDIVRSLLCEELLGSEKGFRIEFFEVK